MRGLQNAVLIVVAVAAGAALPLQAAINARLRVAVGGPVRAALLSFVSGAIVLGFAALALRESWPGASAVSRGPAWMWLGGALGACYVSATIVLVPKLGPAVAFALVVAGQMAASLAIDQVGGFGVPHHPISFARVAGAVLLVCAVALIRR